VENDKVGAEPIGVIVTGTRRGLGATAGENLYRKYRPWNLRHCLFSH